MAKQQKIQCPNCKSLHTLQKFLTKRYPLSDTIAYGVKCPKCGFQKHTHFETPAIVSARTKMRAKPDKEVRAQFATLFDQEQERVRFILARKEQIMSKKIADLEKEIGTLENEPNQAEIDKAQADALRKAAKERQEKQK